MKYLGQIIKMGRRRKVTRQPENWKSYKKEVKKRPIWESDVEMRESLFLSPPLLSFYSLMLRPQMCIWIWSASFWTDPSNQPSVFGQAWKSADSIQSVMTREWRTQPQSVISSSAAASGVPTHARRLTFLQQRSQMQDRPWKALHRSMARWFMRQWSTAQWQHSVPCQLNRCLRGPEILSVASQSYPWAMDT